MTSTPVLRALQRAKQHGVVIVGASPKPTRASNDVMASLMSMGVKCTPVNPLEKEILGQPCFPSLGAFVDAARQQPQQQPPVGGETSAPTDAVVCVFRSDVAPVVEEAADLRFACLWLQFGLFVPPNLRHRVKDLEVVEDQCLKVDMATQRSMGKL